MNFLEQYKIHLLKVIDKVDLTKISQAIEWLQEARIRGRQIFICGNGGSAATASHLACDLVKDASYNRSQRFRVMALTDSLPTITAYANDVSFESVFVEPLQNFAQPGDLVIGISGSGNSRNIVRALEYANSINCRTIALTGRNGGKLASLAQLNIQVPASHMGQIQDVHMMICHMISYYFINSEK